MKKTNFSPIHVVTKKDSQDNFRPALFLIGSSLMVAFVGLYALLYFTLGPRFWDQSTQTAQLPKPGTPNKDLTRVGATQLCTAVGTGTQRDLPEGVHKIDIGSTPPQLDFKINTKGCHHFSLFNSSSKPQGFFISGLSKLSNSYYGPPGAPVVSGIPMQTKGSTDIVNFLLGPNESLVFAYDFAQSHDNKIYPVGLSIAHGGVAPRTGTITVHFIRQ